MSYTQFVSDIKRELAPVYLLLGKENYQKNLAVQQFKRLISPELQDLNFLILDGDMIDTEAILTEASTYPFMGDRRVIIVRNFKLKSKEDGQKKKSKQNDPLLKYLLQPCNSTVLVFLADEINKNTKFYKAIPKKFEFKKLSRGEIMSFLRAKAESAGKKIDATALEILISSSDNLNQLINELEKLLSYTGARTEITTADVTALVPDPNATIFEVVDAIGQNNEIALKGIKDLLAMKQPGPRILAMISRQFTLILKAKESKDAYDFASKAGLPSFIANKVFKQAGNYNKEQVIKSICRLAKADRSIKLGEEFYPAMQKFLLEM